MDGLAAHAQFRVGTEIADDGQKLVHEHSSLVCKTQGADTGGSHWSACPGGLSDIPGGLSDILTGECLS